MHLIKVTIKAKIIINNIICPNNPQLIGPSFNEPLLIRFAFAKANQNGRGELFPRPTK